MMTKELSLTSESLFRMVRDIFVDELKKSRRTTFDAHRSTSWHPGTELRHGGIDLDSLERFTLAARLNETFALHESGVEDYLLKAKTLGDTVEVIQTGLHHGGTSLTFFTGGTTAQPRQVSHRAADLNREVSVLAEILADRRRVVVTVPVHHIYGFLFGVLVPQALGIDVVDAQYRLLSGDARPRNGDLIVSIPFLWDRYAPRVSHWGAGIVGTSSTAPLDTTVAGRLCEAGLQRLIEVFGSSETAGIGWREHGPAPGDPVPFELFPFWTRRADGMLVGTATTPRRHDERVVEPPDRLTWLDDRRFLPAGRKDDVVQVGGVNVDLGEVRDTILRTIPEAVDCAVRLGSGGRLRAFVAAPAGVLTGEDVTRVLAEHLPDVALPRSVTVGEALPRTPTGKVGDWRNGGDSGYP